MVTGKPHKKTEELGKKSDKERRYSVLGRKTSILRRMKSANKKEENTATLLAAT